MTAFTIEADIGAPPKTTRHGWFAPAVQRSPQKYFV